MLLSNKEASKKYRQLYPERRKATTKKWRANCNKALGLFLDSKELLISAENYLSTCG